MPNTFQDSRVLSGQEVTRLAAAIAGTYVVPTASGGAVSTSAAMTVAVAAITTTTGLYVNGTQDTTGYAGGTTVIATADPTNPRRDYVWYDGAGAIGNTTGTPAANPVLPDLTTGRIALAEIYVTAGLATIAAGNIIDRRANVAAAAAFFDIERTAFRANRRLVAQYVPVDALTAGTQQPIGLGFWLAVVAAGEVVTNISGEPIQRFSVAAISGSAGIIGARQSGNGGTLSPNHSPRMLVRGQLPATSANVTAWQAGFFSANSATTANGAYLRIVTTGNVFFVTQQGGVETTTDLGVLSRVAILGFEIETADAGVTWVCRNQAGTALATHTTNIPTAATALYYGSIASIATSAIPWGIASCTVEGTFS